MLMLRTTTKIPLGENSFEFSFKKKRCNMKNNFIKSHKIATPAAVVAKASHLDTK